MESLPNRVRVAPELQGCVVSHGGIGRQFRGYKIGINRSSCGVGTARGIACAYGVFATGGRELGLRRATLDLLAAPAIPAPSK